MTKQLNNEELRSRQDGFDYLLEQLGRAFAMPASEDIDRHELAEDLCCKMANDVEHLPRDVAVNILGRAFMIVKDADPIVAKKIVAEVTHTHGYDVAVLTADL